VNLLLTFHFSLLTYSSVQRDSASVADARHALRERGVLPNPSSKDVAAFRLFLHQHPARVKAGTRLHRELPYDAVPFVHEVRYGESFV
jgi:hypothetical protein